MPSDLKITLTFISVVAVLAVVWAVSIQWHERGWPGGYQAKFEAAVQDMNQAYSEGRYADVVRIYKTPIPVPLEIDIRFPLVSAVENVDLKLQAADSYARMGDDTSAGGIYFEFFGWGEKQYRAYCKLAGECNDFNLLKALALQSESKEG